MKIHDFLSGSNNRPTSQKFPQLKNGEGITVQSKSICILVHAVNLFYGHQGVFFNTIPVVPFSK